jgi:hypothetical protein
VKNKNTLNAMTWHTIEREREREMKKWTEIKALAKLK